MRAALAPQEIFQLTNDLADGRADGGRVQKLAVDLFDFLKERRELQAWERAQLCECAAALQTNWFSLALSHLWLALEPPEGRCACAETPIAPARLRAMLAGA